MEYKISVVILTYNVEMYIERCLVSMFEQTMDDVEYIFVNDCTPDQSMQVLEEVIAKYPDRQKHIRIINHESNQGFSAARNTGLDAATGEYLYYADGDDWAEKTMLADMYAAAKEKDSEIVWCDFYYSYPTFDKYEKQESAEDSVACIKFLLTGKIMGSCCTKIVKRALYTNHTIRFRGGHGEDLRVSVELFYYAKKVAYLPKAYYRYVKYNQTSTSSRELEVKLDELRPQIDGIIEFLEDKNFPFDKYIYYLKLRYKWPLLLTYDKDSFRKWRQIYPESNKYIWTFPDQPFHFRLLGGFTSLKLWPLIDLWIWTKKLRIRMKAYRSNE